MLMLFLASFGAACGQRLSRVQIRPLATGTEAVLASPLAASPSPAVPPLDPSSSLATASATPAPPMSTPLALVISFTFPVDDVSLAQAQALMAGSLDRWSELGGPDLPVQRLSWNGSGVQAASSLSVADLSSIATSWDALVKAVAAEPGALALVPWRGPWLHSKGLSIDGLRPDDAGYPLYTDTLRLPSAPPARGSFSLAAAGDLMLGRRVAQIAGDVPDYPLALVAGSFQHADIGYANLEVALTNRGVAAHKDYTFRAPPELADGLRTAGITVLSVANNHVLDYGPTGLVDTLTALDNAGIAHAGAGSDAAQAAAPAVLDIRGTRVAFLSFVNVPNDSVTGFVTHSMAAGPERPGVNWGTPAAVTRAVTAAKADADVVIVTLHAGTEYADEPNAVQRSLAHAAIDAGAALVIGAHPHVLQGIEYYHQGVILYSLGNFVFDLDGDDIRHYGLAAAQTVVARVDFAGGHVQGLELLPAMIDTSQYRPVPAAGQVAAAILQRVERLTDALAQPAESPAKPYASPASASPSR